MNIFKNLLISMRPKQWTKNLFLFTALFFVKAFTDLDKVLLATEAFALFCLASSAVYLLNDIADLPKDREHPFKRLRPLAAGKINAALVAVMAVLLGASAIIGGFYLNFWFGLTVVGYILLNIAYSLLLKNLIILDVFTIAIGFVIRVVAGAVAINVPFSSWLILCTFFLTLFLAINKRKGELLFNSASGNRSVLRNYSAGFLDQMSLIALSATIISYTFYTFSSEHSKLLMLTVPIVLYGLFKYLFIVNESQGADDGPSDIFLREFSLQLTVLVWIAAVALVLLYGK
ncbi:MAG: decaprenyl-phosphate phosphoribosyltransferase [bacterium]|nr:decaprenyl-phosphate phosphoribosyltransferase [bacterium]